MRTPGHRSSARSRRQSLTFTIVQLRERGAHRHGAGRDLCSKENTTDPTAFLQGERRHPGQRERGHCEPDVTRDDAPVGDGQLTSLIHPQRAWWQPT